MTYIDTGAMYRAVALGVIKRGIRADAEEAIKAELNSMTVSVEHDATSGEQIIYLNGEDVTSKIRTPEISIGASDVSRIPEVRLRMVELQRKIAEDRDVIMDGRDIGTYVFPNANKKYYLTAASDERARRRYAELKTKGGCVTYEECLADLRYRDENDSNRDFAPLAMADDAIYVETDNMTAQQVADFLRCDIMNTKVDA
jgi:cytidylate kinase